LEVTWQVQIFFSPPGDQSVTEMNMIWCSMEMSGPDIYEAALE
jgi:hypothetical protein